MKSIQLVNVIASVQFSPDASRIAPITLGEIASPRACMHIIDPAVANGCFSKGTESSITAFMGDIHENMKNSANPRRIKNPAEEFTKKPPKQNGIL
jgi:hypothetical protein